MMFDFKKGLGYVTFFKTCLASSYSYKQRRTAINTIYLVMTRLGSLLFVEKYIFYVIDLKNMVVPFKKCIFFN